MILNGEWFLELPAGKSCNISHGHLGEVKEILKKLGDDPFGIRYPIVLAGAQTLLE
jgi:hypothetical protein